MQAIPLSSNTNPLCQTHRCGWVCRLTKSERAPPCPLSPLCPPRPRCPLHRAQLLAISITSHAFSCDPHPSAATIGYQYKRPKWTGTSSSRKSKAVSIATGSARIGMAQPSELRTSTSALFARSGY